MSTPETCEEDLDASTTKIELSDLESQECYDWLGSEVPLAEAVKTFVRYTTIPGGMSFEDVEKELLAMIPPSKACFTSNAIQVRVAGSNVACLPWGCFGRGRKRSLMEAQESSGFVNDTSGDQMEAGGENQFSALTACQATCCLTLIVKKEDADAAFHLQEQGGRKGAEAQGEGRAVDSICDSKPYRVCCNGRKGKVLKDGEVCYCNKKNRSKRKKCEATKRISKDGTIVFEDIAENFACMCKT